MARQKRVTLRDIANACGVDTSTVSRVLNNRLGPRFSVTEEKARRIRETAQKLGYKPNSFAKSLRERRSPLIGISFPCFHEELDINYARLNSPRNPGPVPGNMMTGIIQACHQRQYFAVNVPRFENSGTKRITEHELLPDIVAGVLYIHPNPAHLEYIDISNSGGPLLIIGSCPAESKVPQIDVNNRLEMQNLTARLLDRGCRRPLLLLTSPSHLQLMQDRREGFLQALAEANQPVEDAILIDNENCDEATLQHLTRTLLENPDIDALILGTHTDYIGVGEVLRHIQEKGRNKPTLASFDPEAVLFPNLELDYWIEFPYFQWGLHAATHLIDQIEDNPPPTELYVPHCSIQSMNV